MSDITQPKPEPTILYNVGTKRVVRWEDGSVDVQHAVGETWKVVHDEAFMGDALSFLHVELEGVRADYLAVADATLKTSAGPGSVVDEIRRLRAIAGGKSIGMNIVLDEDRLREIVHKEIERRVKTGDIVVEVTDDPLHLAAYKLSTWAATINWDGSGNMHDWLEGLAERINAVQALTREEDRTGMTMAPPEIGWKGEAHLFMQDTVPPYRCAECGRELDHDVHAETP